MEYGIEGGLYVIFFSLSFWTPTTFLVSYLMALLSCDGREVPAQRLLDAMW